MNISIDPLGVYKTEEAAKLLKLNHRTIQRLIREDKLKATRIGNKYRIQGQALLEFLGGDQGQH